MTTDREPGGETPLANAAQHAELGLPIPKGERLRFVKRVSARLHRRSTHEQVGFNRAALAALEGQQRAIEDLAVRIGTLVAHVERLSAETEALRVDQRRELARWRSDHSLVQTILRDVRAGRAPVDAAASLAAHPDGHDEFYADFENMHRGSDALIRGRLAAYVPDLRAISALGRVLDIGTGRGEFLELMRDAQIDAYGVDTNAVTVQQCAGRGLDVVEADAIAYLADLPEASLGAITAFHLIEHLPFDRLLELVDQAVRVIAPDGLLIFETPNPGNLVVGASNFYIDPTHLRPIPPPLLHAVLWSRGFDPIEVRYMNAPDERFELPEVLGEEAEFLRPIVDRLNTMLFSPADYAALGRRAGP